MNSKSLKPSGKADRPGQSSQSTADIQSPNIAPKRFIAGAVCPRCGEMDRIVAYTVNAHLQRKECVACGFNEGLDDKQEPPDLETRVNRRRKAKAMTQPLRFYGVTPKPIKPNK